MSSTQTVVMTGASRGIGAAAAVALARPGRRLALLARSIEGLEQTRRAVVAQGAEAVVIPADLSSIETATDVSERLLQQLGQMDVLLLNAGTINSSPFVETNTSDIAYELQVNYLAPLTLIQRCLPTLQRQPAGQVICVGSLASLMPFPGEATYAASKAALFSLIRSLRAELAGGPVAFTMVLPGYTRTQMTEHHRTLLPAMSAERVGEVIAQCLDDRPEVVIPGLSNRLTARLFSALPGFSDRMLRILMRLGLPIVPTAAS